MNRETLKEATDLLQQAQKRNDGYDPMGIENQLVLKLVLRVLVIVLTELTLIGCSGVAFSSNNNTDSGEQWSSDASLSDPTTSSTSTNDAAAGAGTTLTDTATGGQAESSLGGGGGSTSSPASSSSGGFLAAIGGSTSNATGGVSAATGGASQYHDPGECPCPQNNACQVSASGCNVPGTKGNEGNETFTCVTSPLHCATAARPVFCFQC